MLSKCFQRLINPLLLCKVWSRIDSKGTEATATHAWGLALLRQEHPGIFEHSWCLFSTPSGLIHSRMREDGHYMSPAPGKIMCSWVWKSMLCFLRIWKMTLTTTSRTGNTSARLLKAPAVLRPQAWVDTIISLHCCLHTHGHSFSTPSFSFSGRLKDVTL